MPQGGNAVIDKVLLQAPGISQDSAVNGSLHIRNEHADMGYRINGVMLPDSVAGLGQIIDSTFVGSLNVLTGALPAQFGLRTAGVVDIQTRSDAFNNTGRASIYGGSRETITPSVEYGGTCRADGANTPAISSAAAPSTPGAPAAGPALISRAHRRHLGIDNPTGAINAIHD